MPKANILVVEDESIVSKDIQSSLKKLNYNISAACSTGEEAVLLSASEKPDLVLMDIMLKGKISGIDAAEKITSELSIPVIFLTAYADESTLSKAKLSEPYGYILKPFKEIDLSSSIEMAIYKHQKFLEMKKERDLFYSLVEGKEGSKDFVFVKSNSKLIRVDTKEIFFIEALKDYVVINTLSTRYTIHSTMKEIEKRLLLSDFIRVHRSFIVRTDKIVAIENNTLILEKDKKLIPIGGSYRDELLERLNMI